MSPPISPRRTDLGALALSSGVKIFLSATVLLLGTTAALPFFRDKIVSPVPSPTDERLLTAPLPEIAAVPLPNAVTATLPEPSAQAAAPAIAEKIGKYAQAYPEPILVSKALPPKVETKTAEMPGDAGGKPVVVPLREFASIHPFTASTTAYLDRKSMNFEKQPESIDQSKIVDALLPVFHFAENMKPLSAEAVKPTPPENPFQQHAVTVSETERRLSPLRPYVELRPLRLP